jgi:transposase
VQQADVDPNFVADVNGAYNILRKVIPNAFSNGIGGAVVHPVRVQPA